ncbi:helix-turn-helix domain-containing protein [Paenibacillus glycinis]|uniref:Helix-turn-helix domain-containing protein n=1 Tax=Paenibacillus glycinis TaxID=2697035 RepID=A0ABW9XTG9_9BACL|nr:helix-turn-helix transcriptional regulator [Paenibacillus glycinis]NBD25617.1 helix-turn-helix domain-containing protein [Paenibacillus glycinis]
MNDNRMKDQEFEAFGGEEKEEGNSINPNFGLLLKHLRVRVKGMSIRELAEGARISPAYLNRLERGKRNPTILTVYRLAKALEIPYSNLMEPAFQQMEPQEVPTLVDVIIRNTFTIKSHVSNKESKILVVKIIEYIIDCEWSSKSKCKDLYLLSEMMEELKGAI